MIGSITTNQHQVAYLVDQLLDPAKSQEALIGLAEFVDDERLRGTIRRYGYLYYSLCSFVYL